MISAKLSQVEAGYSHCSWLVRLQKVHQFSNDENYEILWNLWKFMKIAKFKILKFYEIYENFEIFEKSWKLLKIELLLKIHQNGNINNISYIKLYCLRHKINIKMGKWYFMKKTWSKGSLGPRISWRFPSRISQYGRDSIPRSGCSAPWRISQKNWGFSGSFQEFLPHTPNHPWHPCP